MQEVDHGAKRTFVTLTIAVFAFVFGLGVGLGLSSLRAGNRGSGIDPTVARDVTEAALRQSRDYERQLQAGEAHLKKAEAYGLRPEKLLEKSEEQSQRIDSLLDQLERFADRVDNTGIMPAEGP